MKTTEFKNFFEKVIWLRSAFLPDWMRLNGSFSWIMSPEGYTFWETVYKEYKKGIYDTFNHKFKESDYPYIDEICSLNAEILRGMHTEQQAQGNKPDLLVFAKYPEASTPDGGFSWVCTVSPEYWSEIFRKVLGRKKISNTESSTKESITKEPILLYKKSKITIFKPINKVKSYDIY